MNRGGLCETCLSPGACCKRIVLSGGGYGPGLGPRSRESAEHIALAAGLPMVPAHQRPDGIWEYSCTALQRDGRCGIYETRPQLCRHYPPGEDALCVHHWANPDPGQPEEKTDEDR